MRTFADNRGREWELAINYAGVRRVKALLGVYLPTAAGVNLIQRIDADIGFLVDVLYALCKPQAQQRGIVDTDFGEAMAGDAFDRAAVCFFQELADFFPEGQRVMLNPLLARINPNPQPTMTLKPLSGALLE